jgi:hypothetical protein
MNTNDEETDTHADDLIKRRTQIKVHPRIDIEVKTWWKLMKRKIQKVSNVFAKGGFKLREDENRYRYRELQANRQPAGRYPTRLHVEGSGELVSADATIDGSRQSAEAFMSG